MNTCRAIIDRFGQEFHDAFQQLHPFNEDTELFEFVSMSESRTFKYTIERRPKVSVALFYKPAVKMPKTAIGTLERWADSNGNIIGAFYYAADRNTLFYYAYKGGE